MYTEYREMLAHKIAHLRLDHEEQMVEFELHNVCDLGRDTLDSTERSRARQMTLSRIRRIETQIQSYSNAIQRIENDHYGICKFCRESIELERLKSHPEVMTCAECAQYKN
ncbi:dksA/traR C4-type zinc finger [Vibrio xiamenensis]|uniref:DksA/traR C4-type zinc finger n=1 Tax=Vibrio xiamenensis TaxID=861298 RepID=A0A1G8CK11_9VIBR|nr:dksA/traR C4-type zinc finger [Vibrio xiamenensis]